MATLPPFSDEPGTQFDLGLEGGVNPEVPAEPESRPIDRLGPGTSLHREVLKKLLDRLAMSERKMTPFYNRWRLNEKKMQAYVDLPDYERLMKQLSAKNAEPPPLISLTVPYTFATIWTIVTYLAQTFTGRKPMFTVGTNRGDMVKAAENMEIKLQYDADHVRLIRTLFQFFLDGEMYGAGIIRTLWKVDRKWRTVWTDAPIGGQLAPDTPMTKLRQREKHVVYEGNDCMSVDPFMFFPDPRVPMVDCSRRGEFVFWRTFEGKHTLKKAEADGLIKWLSAVGNTLPANIQDYNQSQRNLVAGGDSFAGGRDSQDLRAAPFYQSDQGTVELIPAEWGIGDSEEPEKWIFTVLNKTQIVQAEPLDLDHDMHPIAVIEPYTFGYGFGQVGMADMLGPLQDTVSWFINSHIHNVRSSLNNSFIVNPSAIEMQDLKQNGPGKIIRLKPSAYGMDVTKVINQLAVSDVTQAHISDMQNFIRIGDTMSAVNDNLRGIQSVGGRKTATEVRTSTESGASRLASHARLISSQGVVDLTEQMSLNTQQNLTEEFYVKVVGPEGTQPEHRIIRPEELVGDFYFPIHDGTLPIDKVAMLDIWREILTGVAQDPQLRTQYDIGKIFEFVAELGGAKNISSFKVVPQDQMAQLEQGAQDGNMVPVGGSNGGMDPAMLLQLLGGGR